MNKLPPALDGLASFVDAQPDKVRDIYVYGLFLMMVEAGWMKLVRAAPGDDAARRRGSYLRVRDGGRGSVLRQQAKYLS